MRAPLDVGRPHGKAIASRDRAQPELTAVPRRRPQARNPSASASVKSKGRRGASNSRTSDRCSSRLRDVTRGIVLCRANTVQPRRIITSAPVTRGAPAVWHNGRMTPLSHIDPRTMPPAEAKSAWRSAVRRHGFNAANAASTSTPTPFGTRCSRLPEVEGIRCVIDLRVARARTGHARRSFRPCTIAASKCSCRVLATAWCAAGESSPAPTTSRSGRPVGPRSPRANSFPADAPRRRRPHRGARSGRRHLRYPTGPRGGLV